MDASVTEGTGLRPDRLSLTGRALTFPAHELIVSKTDLRGIMTYVNDIFMSVSGYREDELIGRPHSLIRHPHMPRCVFKLLWDKLAAGEEVFAYVVNRAKNGDHYWVFAHVTPSYDRAGKVVAYHSCRRVPKAVAVETIEPIYKKLLAEEAKHGGQGRAAVEASTALLFDVLSSQGLSYDEFVLSL